MRVNFTTKNRFFLMLVKVLLLSFLLLYYQRLLIFCIQKQQISINDYIMNKKTLSDSVSFHLISNNNDI